MNGVAFFNAVRGSLFGGSLSQAQVDGMNALLAAGPRYGLTNAHHMANVLAQVFHETGRHMKGIKETVMPHHADRNPSDETVISRLDSAFARGQLTWVKKPYWRKDAAGRAWFGRGMVQLTHEANYRKLGQRIGADLVANPALALDDNIGASIAVVGMKEGLFTGKKLGDFDFPGALSQPPAKNPRRIINGQDGTDADVANYHRRFHAALIAAGWGEVAEPAPTPPARPAPTPPNPPADSAAQPNWGARIFLAIIAIGGLALAAFFALFR